MSMFWLSCMAEDLSDHMCDCRVDSMQNASRGQVFTWRTTRTVSKQGIQKRLVVLYRREGAVIKSMYGAGFPARRLADSFCLVPRILVDAKGDGRACVGARLESRCSWNTTCALEDHVVFGHWNLLSMLREHILILYTTAICCKKSICIIFSLDMFCVWLRFKMAPQEPGTKPSHVSRRMPSTASSPNGQSFADFVWNRRSIWNRRFRWFHRQNLTELDRWTTCSKSCGLGWQARHQKSCCWSIQKSRNRNGCAANAL